jgi:hypothetical protein
MSVPRSTIRDMMTAAAGLLGGAATPQLELRRARLAVADAAEHLTATCREVSASPEDVAAAERQVSDAFAAYGGLLLLSRSAR